MVNYAVVVMGNKMDLYDGNNPDHVSREEAEEVLMTLGIKNYFECSAKTGVGVVDAFN